MSHLVLKSSLSSQQCLEHLSQLQAINQDFKQIWLAHHHWKVLIEVQYLQDFLYFNLDFRREEEVVVSIELASEPPRIKTIKPIFIQIYQWLKQLSPSTKIVRHTLGTLDQYF